MRASLPRWLRLTAGGLLASALSLSADQVDDLAKELLQSAQFWGVQLSPDGSHLAMYQSVGDLQTVGTYDLEKRKGGFLRPDRGTDVYRFGWIDGDHIIFSVSEMNLYHQGLHLIHEGLRSREHLDKDHKKQVFSLVSTLPQVRGEALVENVLNRPFSSFHRFGRTTGFREIVDRHEFLQDWSFDPAGNFRVKLVGTTPNEYVLFHRRDDRSPWEVLEIEDVVALHGFNHSAELLYVTYTTEGRTVLRGYDPIARAFVGGTIQDPHYAVDPVMIRTHDTGDVVGVTYDADKPVINYFEPNIAAAAQLLQRSLPDLVHSFMGVRPGGSIFFYSYSDRQPGIVHELDIQNRALKRVLETRPGLDASKSSPMVPFTCPARDGATLRGYYTLPAGADPDAPTAAPMVVVVHGGPQARDYWGYDQEVQFFSRLGYAVLQVNYRGSENMYEEQGSLTYLQVCDYAVDDVVDATRWMVEKGFADPERMAIYGWSFGAYTALACAARYPDLFRSAYAAGGVYDFNALWEERTDPGRFRAYLEWDEAYLGDLTDAEAWRKVSPVHQANQIQVPVFLLHGDDDGVVGTEQSRAMFKALRAAGKPVELETPSWLRHGPQNESERLKFTKSVYRFIEKHMP